MSYEEIINLTVERTIKTLLDKGLLRSEKNAYEKTEDLLRNYRKLQMSAQTPKVRKVIGKINEALKFIEHEPYSQVIYLYYIENLTRDTVASMLDISPTTVARTKGKLLDEIKVILFSDDFIDEIYGEFPDE